MKLVLIGAAGYGSRYVNALLYSIDKSVEWVGVIDPYYERCATKEIIDAAKIPVYSSLEEFYEHDFADFVIISTPTFLHHDQSILALSHGSYVLCEKPVASTVAEAVEMMEAEKKYDRFIAIGFQWSFSSAIQLLKKDVLSGKLGAPVSFKTAISWPRNKKYYGRGGGWAGRIQKDGIVINDSIASNACAHYIHNMLFLLGETMESAMEVGSFDAECYRANPIESFDTCSIKLKTESGVPLFFIASHATKTNKDPEFSYVFDNATVSFSGEKNAHVIATFKSGEVKDYGDPFENNYTKKLWDSVEAARNGTHPICTVSTAMPHTRFIERLFDSLSVTDFPKESVKLNEQTDGYYIEGLFERLYEAYEKEVHFSEI
jgi:predicted dehydrogenase